MRRREQGRAGFSLMEVLVVVTIIVMVLSLMLPSLHSAREAARRSQCINNLRQLGLAVQNYAYIHEVYPPGVVDRRGPIRNDGTDGLRIGWLTQLLPFMEQMRLYETIDTGVPVDDPANATAARTSLTTLLCPSDPQPGAAGPRTPLSSYAACHHDVEAPIDVNNHGVFFLNSSVRPGDIPDGLSTTIFVGEKLSRPGDLGNWMWGTRATLRNTGTPINAPPPPGADAVGGYSSRHFDGANFGFGDGSVRFLTKRINPAVYRLLGHRDDGEPIDDDSLRP